MILDLDGTLVDSLPDITRALNIALAESGVPPLPAEVVRTLVGEGVVKLAERALAVAPAGRASRPFDVATITAVAERIRTIYKIEPCVHTRLYDGMAETLAALRAEPRRRLALLTNKPGEVMRPLLTALGLDDRLDAAIGDGDGYPRKPDPGALHALMSRFGVTAAHTLMVGDGLPDMAVARAAGCSAAAAIWGYSERADLLATQPQFTLATPHDLLAIV